MYFIFLIITLALGYNPQPAFQIVEKDHQIDILADGELFTTYRYSDDLLKPALYPIYSPSQIRVQRQYPLKKVEGESHDHEHHVGLFFTYGSEGEVNGSSFWSKHDPPPRIQHKEVTQKETEKNEATLGTRSNWIGKDSEIILVEDRTMNFSKGESQRSIDFTLRLQAQDEEVIFKDTKEGMFGIRVADWLSEEHGNGSYLNAEGETTSENVWGKRSKWVRLEGTRDGKTVGVAILNHPTSVNYPTFWHARGYGLFAANPLGQSIFQESRGVDHPEPLNYTIPAGESGLFKFKVIVYEGHRSAKQIEEQFSSYSS